MPFFETGKKLPLKHSFLLRHIDILTDLFYNDNAKLT